MSPFCLSIPLEGKNQVKQHDVIPILVHLLKDQEPEVQANAAGALMNAAVTTEGKLKVATLGCLQLDDSKQEGKIVS